MPRQKKPKPIRLYDRRYFVVNIKLISPERSGAEAYRDLLFDTWNNKIKAQVTRDRYGIFRSFFRPSGEPIIHGTICLFLNITGEDWVNLANMEIEGQEIPSEKFPGSRETDFVFYPSVHRLCIRKNSIISLSSTITFLKSALQLSCREGESVQVYVEQASDGFEEILSAKEVRHLFVEITPPNGDTTADFARAIEHELRELNSSVATLDLRAPQGQTLKPSSSELAMGFLELARSNGYAHAQITDTNDKRKTVKTDEHPRVFNARAPKNQIDAERISLKEVLYTEFQNGDET